MSLLMDEEDILNNGHGLTKENFIASLIASGANTKIFAATWLKIRKKEKSSSMQLLKDIVKTYSGNEELRKEDKSPLIFNKKYQKQLCNFLEQSMTLEIVTDASFMDDLYNILIAESCSSFQRCRFTASLIVCEIYNTLLKSEQIISEKIADVDKLSENQNLEINSLTVDKNRIQCQLNYVFGKFIKRFWRDVESKIRMFILNSLQKWIVLFPKTMANDEFLKYITWLLTDVSSKIRLTAIQAIISITNNIPDKKCLEPFLRYNAAKLGPRILDVDDHVAATAIEALTLINSIFNNVLSTNICKLIYEKVYSNNQSVAESASLFLCQKLTKEEDERNIIPNIIQFQMGVPSYCKGEFLISAVFKHLPSLTNWYKWMMCFNETDESEVKAFICELMVHTIRFSATLERPPWKTDEHYLYPTTEILFGMENRPLNDPEKKIVTENINKITNYFSNRIINLIDEYKEQTDCVIYFLQIPRFIEYQTNSKVMLQIIDYMEQLVLTSKDLKVVHNCLYNFTLITNKMSKGQKDCVWEKQNHLVSNLVHKICLPNIEDLIENKKKINQSLEINFEKLVSLATCINLTNTCLFEVALKALEAFIEEKDEFGVKTFANICFLNVSHKLHEILNVINSSMLPSEEEIEKLKILSRNLLKNAIKIISKDFSKVIKSMAFTTWCHVMILFSKHEKMEKLPQAVIQPSRFDAQWIIYFINTTVPDAYEKGENPSAENENLLNQYCTLLEKCVLPVTALVNIVPFFKTKAYNKILTKPLLSALYHPVVMRKAITCIVNSLGCLLQDCYQNKLTEEALHNILEGLCLSLKQKHVGFDQLMLYWQISGLEYIRLSGKKMFFRILDFFVPLIPTKNIIVILQGLVQEYFANILNDRVVQTYTNSLAKAIENEKLCDPVVEEEEAEEEQE